MSGLFDNDPVFKQGKVTMKSELVRNSRGQFCTKEEKRIEGIEKENRILKRKAEMYLRNWQVIGHRAARLDRENHKLKEELESCKKELRSLKRKVGKRKPRK